MGVPIARQREPTTIGTDREAAPGAPIPTPVPG